MTASVVIVDWTGVWASWGKRELNNDPKFTLPVPIVVTGCVLVEVVTWPFTIMGVEVVNIV